MDLDRITGDVSSPIRRFNLIDFYFSRLMKDRQDGQVPFCGATVLYPCIRVYFGNLPYPVRQVVTFFFESTDIMICRLFGS